MLTHPSSHFSVMRTCTLATFITLLLVFSAAAEISIEMIQPEQGQLTGSSVLIQVGVESEFEIASVTMSVEGRELALEFGLIPWGPIQRGVWLGTIDLEGLTGEVIGSVTAVDVLGNTQVTATNTFIIDKLPLLTVAEPSNFAVATPHIRLKAVCADDSGSDCVFLVEAVTDRDSFPVFESNASEIDEILDLSAFDHSEISLRITAIDPAGQRASFATTIFVESSSRLIPIRDGSAKILDDSFDRILYTNSGDSLNTLNVFDRGNGESTTVYSNLESGIVKGSAFLAPLGVIFIASLENDTHETVVEVREDEIIEFRDPSPAFALEVEGKYAIWNNGPKLILRDLIAGINTTISETAGFEHNLSEDGCVTYWDLGEPEGVFFYRDGTSMPLETVGEYQISGVLTDGKNAIYQKSQEVLGERFYKIALNDGTSESILLDTGMYRPNSGFDYDMVEGWVAIRKPGNSGQQQIWMFKVGESPVKRTLFGSTSQIIEINERGQLIFENEERNSKYISYPNGRFDELGTYIGETFWQDRRWQVVVGDTLFALNTRREAIPSILDFDINEGGTFLLEFESQEGRTLMLQSSENTKDWVDIREIEAFESSILLESLGANSSPAVYYRILVK